MDGQPLSHEKKEGREEGKGKERKEGGKKDE